MSTKYPVHSLLVEISDNTTRAVSNIEEWLRDVVADGLLIEPDDVRVVRPTGGETRTSDPGSTWLRFPTIRS